MKKLTLIIAGLLMFTLGGCNDKPAAVVSSDKGNTPVKVNTSPKTTVTIAPQAGFFAEDENYIFSTDSNYKGIVRVDKKTGESKTIYDKGSLESFFMTEKSIYFMDYTLVADRVSRAVSVWRIDKDGSDLCKVLDESQFPQSDNVDGNMGIFEVDGHRLFVHANYQSYLYMYDMGTKELKNLSLVTWNFHLDNDTIYSGGKPWKANTIYKMNLTTMKGEQYFKKEDNTADPIYDSSPLFFGSKMYLLSDPYTLSVVEDGVGKAVFQSKDSYLKGITAYKGNIYFVSENNNKLLEVYKFDTTTNTAKKAAEMKGGTFESKFSIINGYLYYCASVNNNPERERRFVKLDE